MRKNYFLIMTLLIAATFGFQTASAQFTITIPKLPKIKKPKVEQRATPTTSGDNQATQNEQLQVKPSVIGKIYFSNKPFTENHDGSRTSFTTSEYIYGRLETSGGTLRDVLKFSPLTKENPQHKLMFIFRLNYSPFGNSAPTRELTKYDYVAVAPAHSFAVLTEADLDKNYWNFEVLPEPAKAALKLYDRSRINGESEIDSESGPHELYKYLKNKAVEETYTIRIELQTETRDFRGNLLEDREKWLTVEGLATLAFKKTDYAKIKADGDQLEASLAQRLKQAKAETDNAELANEPLPNEWALKSNPLLPGLTETSLKAMFLQDHPFWVQKQIVKFYAAAATSRERTVVPNELGIPNYRYLNQKFTVFVKVIGEDKCFYQRFNPSQRYSGGGTFGDYYAIRESRIDVSCQKMSVR